MTKRANTRWQKIYRRFNLSVVWLTLIATFLSVVLYDYIVFTTPVGSASIHWKRLPPAGQDNSIGPLSEGLHLIPPWDVFYTYEVRLQEHMEKYQVLSKDGLHFDMTVRFRWRALKDNVIALNQRIGTDYLNRLLIPEIGSMAREVVAHYEATALYSEKRNEVQLEIYNDLTADKLHNHIGPRDAEMRSAHNFIALQDLLITNVALPKQLQGAIESKLMEAEKVQQYTFRVQREKLESDRKRVEAQGIRAFQEIVTPAISESYLRWRGIEATLSLAESQNSKVVVIGNSETGLPLIFDTRSELGNAPMAPLQNGGSDNEDVKLPEKFGAALGAGLGAQNPSSMPNAGTAGDRPDAGSKGAGATGSNTPPDKTRAGPQANRPENEKQTEKNSTEQRSG